MTLGVATSAIACAFMVASMVLADYCQAPSVNTLQLLPQPSLEYNVTRYYVECSGVNPLNEPYDEAVVGVDAATTFIEQIQEQYCSGPFASLFACCSIAVPMNLYNL